MTILNNVDEEPHPASVELDPDHRLGVLKNFIARVFGSPDRLRLLAELRMFGAQLRVYQGGEGPGTLFPCVALSFQKALSEADHGQREASWRCLEEARRLTFFLMDADELRIARTVLKARGAKVLNGWRAAAFERLMDKSKEAPTSTLLYRAAILIADSQESRFHSINLAQRHTNTMSLILLSLSTLFLLFVSVVPELRQSISSAQHILSVVPELGQSISSAQHSSVVLVGSFLLGGIGACVSALMSFSAMPQNVRIPDRIMNFVTTFVRPVVGAASGLASSLFLLSGAIHIGDLSAALLFIVAFAFGFSERLVINTVNTVSANSGPNAK
jgi:hypothetical protein